MKKVRGFTLIELLIVVAIIAILAAIAVPNFLEAQVRAKVSRVRTDQRSLSIAIEAYYVDNNIYPAWGQGQNNPVTGCQSYNSYIVTSQNHSGGGSVLPNFLVRFAGATASNSFQGLTTPLSYITAFPADAFATNKGETFSYFSVFPGDTRVAPRGGVGWILWSYGPDVDEYKGNTPSDSPYLAYDPAQSQPSTFNLTYPGGLIAGRSMDSGDGGQDQFTYDPTNGTVSGGDIWRVKQ
jgi:prepilin-type N-terminal cleavage/methylation domain-containing protein